MLGARTRRDRNTINQEILSAAREIIKSVGFNNLTVAGITKKAKIESCVFYNRYTGLEDFLDNFVRDYDYWLNDAINFDPVKKTALDNCEELLVELIDSLNSNPIMQKLLAWEIIDDSYITKRTANNREIHSSRLLEYFNISFKDQDVDFNYITALLISGIYYLILHKDISTFCTIDFSKKENIENLKENIRILVKRVYSNTSVDAEKKIIAKRLFEHNVSYDVIKVTTELPDRILKKIQSGL